MNFRIRLMPLFFFLTLQTIAHAYSSVTISLVNNSSHKLEFDGNLMKFPGNEITIDMETINPGETATIIGTITQDYDLSGVIYIKGGINFWISDHRQFHMGQPTFVVYGNNVRSTIQSQTLNQNIQPRWLSYSAATVVISDKPTPPFKISP